MRLKEGLKAQLGAIAGLTAKVGANIYANRVPQTVTGDYCCFYVEATERGRQLSGPAGFGKARIQLEFWAVLQADADAMAEAVRTLDGFSGKWGTVVIDNCVIEDEADDLVPPLHDEGKGLCGVGFPVLVFYQEPAAA